MKNVATAPIINLPELPEECAGFSNLTEHMIECIKIGSKISIIEKIDNIKENMDRLINAPYDTSQFGEEIVTNLICLMKELNLNFAMYVNSRNYQILNFKN